MHVCACVCMCVCVCVRVRVHMSVHNTSANKNVLTKYMSIAYFFFLYFNNINL